MSLPSTFSVNSLLAPASSAARMESAALHTEKPKENATPGVVIRLQDVDLWERFSVHINEMIVTKSGR